MKPCHIQASRRVFQYDEASATSNPGSVHNTGKRDEGVWDTRRTATVQREDEANMLAFDEPLFQET